MTIRSCCTGLLLLVATAAAPATVAAQRAHIGFHGAYNFDIDQPAIGAQVHLPFARGIELYPSFDYYFVDSGSLLGFSGDLKFRSRATPLYFGGGLNILRASAGGSSNSDTGFDVFAGFESRRGWTHPYLEFRGLFHDNSSLQVAVGVNMTLY